MISIDLLDAMVEGYSSMMDHVESDPGVEQVGLLLSTGRVIALVNEIPSPAKFEVSVDQMARALSALDPEIETVVAMFHSHPGGSLEPSQTDRFAMTAQWADGLVLPWVIFDPETGAYGVHQADRGRVRRLFQFNGGIVNAS